MEEEGATLVIEDEAGQEEKVKIDFQVPDAVRTEFANEVAIQALHTEFILSFFEVRLPIIRDPKDKPKDIAKAIKPLCVSRVAISAERIPDLIKALQDRLERFHLAHSEPSISDVTPNKLNEN